MTTANDKLLDITMQAWLLQAAYYCSTLLQPRRSCILQDTFLQQGHLVACRKHDTAVGTACIKTLLPRQLHLAAVQPQQCLYGPCPLQDSCPAGGGQGYLHDRRYSIRVFLLPADLAPSHLCSFVGCCQCCKWPQGMVLQLMGLS